MSANNNANSSVYPTVNSPNVISCPVRMSDGRMFTDYRPKSVVPVSDRLYMINNASEIMQQNMMAAVNESSCIPNVALKSSVPNRTMQACNENTCVFSEVDPNGLGLFTN